MRLVSTFQGDSDATPRIEFSGPAGLVAVWTPRTAKSRTARSSTSSGRSRRAGHGSGASTSSRLVAHGDTSHTLGLDLANTNGRYTFNRAQTGLLGQTNTGHEFASFLLGGAGSRLQRRSAGAFRYDYLLRHVRLFPRQLAHHEQAVSQSGHSIRSADRLAHPWRQRLLARRHQRSESGAGGRAGRAGLLRHGSRTNGRQPVLSHRLVELRTALRLCLPD